MKEWNKWQFSLILEIANSLQCSQMSLFFDEIYILTTAALPLTWPYLFIILHTFQFNNYSILIFLGTTKTLSWLAWFKISYLCFWTTWPNFSASWQYNQNSWDRCDPHFHLWSSPWRWTRWSLCSPLCWSVLELASQCVRSFKIYGPNSGPVPENWTFGSVQRTFDGKICSIVSFDM